MNSTWWCMFIHILYIINVFHVQGYDYDAFPSSWKDRLIVTYEALIVQSGETYGSEFVATTPKIMFPNANAEKLYEVIMVDPDATSTADPTCRGWLHMFLSNVKGSDLRNGISTNSSTGDWKVVAAYMPPGPPKGDGYHRYVEAVFSHAEPFNLEEIEQRCGFDIDLFTKIHNLHQTPEAFNMFKAFTN